MARGVRKSIEEKIADKQEVIEALESRVQKERGKTAGRNPDNSGWPEAGRFKKQCQGYHPGRSST